MRLIASFLFTLFLVGVALSQQPSPDLSKVTSQDIIATMEHRNKLADQRNAQLLEENNGLKNQLASLQKVSDANQGNATIIPDLNKQISAQNGEIASLKWSRWKYAIISVLISVPLGILLAIGSFLAVKAGWAGAQAATKLAAIAVKT